MRKFKAYKATKLQNEFNLKTQKDNYTDHIRMNTKG